MDDLAPGDAEVEREERAREHAQALVALAGHPRLWWLPVGLVPGAGGGETDVGLPPDRTRTRNRPGDVEQRARFGYGRATTWTPAECRFRPDVAVE